MDEVFRKGKQKLWEQADQAQNSQKYVAVPLSPKLHLHQEGIPPRENYNLVAPHLSHWP